MEPCPQKLEQDVLVGAKRPPPSHLVVASSRNGLLEHLVVVDHLPVTVIIVRDVGLVKLDHRHKLPKKG